MFLVKKSDREAKCLRSKICGEYRASKIPYYVEAEKYKEMKYQLCVSELCMEFYLDLLFDLCKPGDRFLGVFMGSKYMVAMQVCIFHIPPLILIWSAVMYHIILELRMSVDPQHNLSSYCVLSLIPLLSNFRCRSLECITMVLWIVMMLTGMT